MFHYVHDNAYGSQRYSYQGQVTIAVYRFDPVALQSSAQALPGWKRVAFMATCCERMLTNYASYNAETGRGDVAVLRQALDAVWTWIETGRVEEDVGTLAVACHLEVPEAAAFVSPYTSAALDAANAIAITLAALGEEASSGRLVQVASLARDSVDLFVQQQDVLDLNGANLERLILNDRLMQTELGQQHEMMTQLKANDGNRHVMAQALRCEWSGNGYGSLPPPAGLRPPSRPNTEPRHC